MSSKNNLERGEKKEVLSTLWNAEKKRSIFNPFLKSSFQGATSFLTLILCVVSPLLMLFTTTTATTTKQHKHLLTQIIYKAMIHNYTEYNISEIT